MNHIYLFIILNISLLHHSLLVIFKFDREEHLQGQLVDLWVRLVLFDWLMILDGLSNCWV